MSPPTQTPLGLKCRCIDYEYCFVGNGKYKGLQYFSEAWLTARSSMNELNRSDLMDQSFGLDKVGISKLQSQVRL